ncbi:MAG: xanthine dehydrogenase family protein molybdopterin-binding subunit, partial [Myxococcales bacterium]
MTRTMTFLGQSLRRVDGRAKVTGEAKYAAEFSAPGLLHGVVVSSTVARGRIRRIDASAALAVPGVVQVFSHDNRPSMPWFDRSYRDQDSPGGSPFRPLYNDEVVYSGQPVALVVAETLEAARHAAEIVHVDYEVQSHNTSLEAARPEARKPHPGKSGFEPPPKPRGDAEQAWGEAPVRIAAEYTCPAEHHNPLEMHATTVIAEPEGKFTVYDKTQSVLNSQSYVAKIFDLSKDDVRVVSPFVGGAFGSALRPQYNLFMAVMAATELKRSVRVSLTRQQMFTFGHRPEIWQRMALACDEQGKLVSLQQEAVAATSQFEDYVEVTVNWGASLYACDNAKVGYKLAPIDTYTPLDMRAPGAVWGMHALECAMDELAFAARVDPLALRLINYAERDAAKDKPYSSKALRECYAQAAERFGWSRRSPEPRSMRDGHTLIGWGMATGVWDAMQQPARAKASLGLDGKLIVGSATADIGPGTYTVMTQIAAATMGLALEDVTFQLGDTSLPLAPLQGGSFTVSSVGSAVKKVCENLREKLLDLACKMPDSPLAGASLDEVVFVDGQVQLARDPARAVAYADAMRAGGVTALEDDVTSLPNKLKQLKYTLHTHSAVFV